MDEKEVLEAIARGESAYMLLYEADKGLERRFKRLCTTIVQLLADVRKHFPDAQYYTASGGLCLMLGNPHNQETGRAQRDLIALDGNGVKIGDGDF